MKEKDSIEHDPLAVDISVYGNMAPNSWPSEAEVSFYKL
jgi:hypothetical protein